MTPRILHRVLSVLLATYSLTSVLAHDAPKSPEELRNALQSALHSKDTNAVVALFDIQGEPNEWIDSPGMRQSSIAMQVRTMLEGNSTSVSLLPLPTAFALESTNEESGTKSIFNLHIVGELSIGGPGGSLVKLPYGRAGDGFYIAGIILQRLPGNLLSVNVSAGPNSDALTFTGMWRYVRGGKKIEVGVSDKTNRFKLCWGDYVESCTIQRTATNTVPGFANWFHFDVLEGGALVFRSPDIGNEEPFTYRSK